MLHQLNNIDFTSKVHKGSNDAQYIDDGQFFIDSVSILVKGLQLFSIDYKEENNFK